MNKIIWFITETRWFIRSSRTYMQGERVTVEGAIKAYIYYMKAVHKDRRAGFHRPVVKREIQ